MKEFNKTFSFITLFLLCCLITSCNGIRYDSAEKEGIKIPSQEAFSFSQINPAPSSVVAFLWPTEEFFNRGQESGQFDTQQDYQSYIRQVSSHVFLASDEFDEWTLRYFSEKRRTTKEFIQMNETKASIITERRSLKKEFQNLKKQEADLKKKIQNTTDEKEKVLLKIELVKVTERKGDVSQARKMKKEQLASIKKLIKALERGLQEINANQIERVASIQQTLDPQAVSLVYDDNGDTLTNDFGFPQRIINEEAQINWMKTYQSSAGQDNYFDISEEKVTISLKGWDGSPALYETKYQKSHSGEWELHPDSTIYEVSFSPDEVLKFKFKERDHNESDTGRIFEFILQRSPFDQHMRLMGDLAISVQGEIVRRGQVKIILLSQQQQ